MMKKLWTVDAHCHWSDARVFGQSREQIPRQIAHGVLGFLLGGVEPEEWRRQTALKARFPTRIWRAFGLHPYFVAAAEAEEETLETAWGILLNEAPRLEALGEMGLDFRKTYLGHGKDRQIRYFGQQLALARDLKKPVILHVVRAHEDALHALKNFALTGMVHAFTGNFTVAARYLDLGYHLSIGTKLLFPESHDLAETVRKTPLNQLLIESDCPDQAPPGHIEHDSITVWTIAERIATLKKLSLNSVVEQTRENLFSLIQKEIHP